MVRGAHVAVEDGDAANVIERERQFLNYYADFCNDCGNCDVFVPEEGGPYKVKPRFFGARATFEADLRTTGSSWRRIRAGTSR